mgnify:CR=1 FL=1
MEEYKRYARYKDSGIDWIGEIPSKWITSKIKHHAEAIGGYPFDSDLFTLDEREGFPLIRIRNILDQNINTYYQGKPIKEAIVKKGELLIGMDGDFNVCWWQNGKALLNQRVCKISIKEAERINKKFLFYLISFPLSKINDTTYFTTVKHLSLSQIDNITIPLPSINEQINIVHFLDDKIKGIERIINKKENLIEKLKEYKKAVITEAVTKGKLGDRYINEDGELVDEIEMKDSGVEWLGKIPEYWDILRLKFLAIIRNGKKQDKVEDMDGEYPILGSGGEFSRANDYLYDKPSVLLGRKGTIDNPQYIEKPFWTVDTLFYTEIKEIIIPKLFYYLTKTIRFDYYSTQTALPSMTQEDLNQIPLPLYKDKNIQRIIVSFIDNKLFKIDNLIQKTKESIKKYKEYKKSLIFEAVTGKIDLRDYEMEEGEDSVKYDNTRKAERESLSTIN